MAAPNINPTHRGRLDRALHVKEGEPIPADRLMKALDSKDPHLRSMANYARMAKRKFKAL